MAFALKKWEHIIMARCKAVAHKSKVLNKKGRRLRKVGLTSTVKRRHDHIIDKKIFAKQKDFCRKTRSDANRSLRLGHDTSFNFISPYIALSKSRFIPAAAQTT
jgi:hypothetical protein